MGSEGYLIVLSSDLSLALVSVSVDHCLREAVAWLERPVPARLDRCGDLSYSATYTS